MRRFLFTMVFTPSRGYMNPTVILRSVGARSAICGKLAPEARKRRPMENRENCFIGAEPAIIFKPEKSADSHPDLEYTQDNEII